ncbi:MAG: response regulator [Gorillibacterium sp.]|nr:response regulator [Gorillibacterium sp.]
MYKVLLVDDEGIILEGIASIVDWQAAGTTLMGTARNGVEAYRMVQEQAPDIIISDIRMPVMNGIELVEKVKESYPHIRFILLSGFDQFEYAQTAMQYGVKHYLLKPCNEIVIGSALLEVVAELTQEQSKAHFLQSMKDRMQKILPQVKEQFLKEFVTNKTYGSEDWEYYRELFGIRLTVSKVRLLLLRLEGKFEYEHLFAVKNIAEDLLEDILLGTNVGDDVLFVIKGSEELDSVLEQIAQVRCTFSRYYKLETSVALSEVGQITEARRLYMQALECLEYRFYLGEGGVITKRDLSILPESLEGFVYDDEKILLPIKAGNWQSAEAEIDVFFTRLAGSRLDVGVTKSYMIQLYIALNRLANEENMQANINRLLQLAQTESLQTGQVFLKNTARDITSMYYDQNRSQHSAIICKVKEIVQQHIGSPELSLSWVAHEMLYMNTDYLGKLFKKETGEKFSFYVVKERILKAVERLGKQEDVKVFELAEQLGFGDNPQYFSQVFKKVVGCAPSEYKKSN